jgi:hypothetical protein
MNTVEHTAAREKAAYSSAVAALQAMARCTAALLDDLSSHLELLGTHERALLLLAAAQLPILGHPGHGSHLLGSLCCTILEAPEPAQQVGLVFYSTATAAAS